MEGTVAMKLTIGNISGGGSPAMGTIREFRVGRSLESSYSFHTLDLNKYNSTWPVGKDVTKARVTEYMGHAHPIRMTSNADMFVPLSTLSSDIDGHWWTRQQADESVTEATGYRNYGQGEDTNQEVGIGLVVTRSDEYASESTADVWMDNAHLKVSNTLWEFNPNDGAGRWYQLYDMPNRKRTRIVLPYPTNRLRFRAVSNDPNEWVQKVGIYPHVDWQAATTAAPTWPSSPLSGPDGFGMLRWKAATGDVAYDVYAVASSAWTKLGRTHGLSFELDPANVPGDCTGYAVMAVPHSGTPLTSNTVSK